jgi:hypothetical protein
MRRVSGETEVREELEFLARVRGWSEEEHSERTGELLAIEKGDVLCRSVVKKGCILHIISQLRTIRERYPRKYGVKTRWWYTHAEEVRCKRCKRCDEVQAQDAFNFDQWKKATGSRCRKCEAQLERPGKRVTREGERKGMRQKAMVSKG